MAFQITSLTVVCSSVYSGADQRKHQSSASQAFVRGIHRWPVNSPHKGPVTQKPRAPSKYKDCLSRYVDFHYSDKTVARPSYLYDGRSYTDNTSLFWNEYVRCNQPCNYLGLSKWRDFKILAYNGPRKNFRVSLAMNEYSSLRLPNPTSVLARITIIYVVIISSII